jgi:iron transport multicopper oxidase
MCKKQGIPTEGNCAGQTRNVLDNSKCNKDLDANPYGAFTNSSKSRKARDLLRDIAAPRAII